MRHKIYPDAQRRIIEIWRYTNKNWGEKQADNYVRGLYNAIEKAGHSKHLWHHHGESIQTHSREAIVNLKVLVADDEEQVLNLIRHTLKRHPFDVETAESSKQALASICRRPPDILITDIHMPGMNGLELMKAALNIKPDLLAIAITGYGDVDTAVAFMKSGGFDYLQKPVNRDVLLMAISSAADRCRLRRELHQSEKALAASERRYRRIFDGAPVGIFQCDLAGRFLRVNPTLARMFGHEGPQAMIEAKNRGRGGFMDNSDVWEDAIARSRETSATNPWIQTRIQGFTQDNRLIIVQNTLRMVQDETDDPAPTPFIEGFVEDVTQEAKRRAAFLQEMERAKDLYDLVAAPGLPLMAGLAIDVACFPAERIGGDLLDFLPIDDHRLLIFLADVTGHGIPAAMTANTLKTLFRAVAEIEVHPSAVCRRLNRIIHDFILPDDIIAIFCGMLDLSAMTLTYYLSGLPSPLILRNREAIPLSPTGLPFGVFEDFDFECNVVSVKTCDMLVAVTDGITEATDPNGEVFGGSGLREAALMSAQGPPDAETIAARASQFRQQPGFTDDVITMVLSFYDDNTPLNRPILDRFQGPDIIRFRLKTRRVQLDKATAFIMDHIRRHKADNDPAALDALKLAFAEMFVNAVEHGNLEMTDLKKNQELYDSDMYWKIFAQRADSAPYSDRNIDVEFRYERKPAPAVSITISQEGPGFNPSQTPDPRLETNRDGHSGRGIAIARMNVDHLFYSPDGRKVTLIKSWSL